ncbi:hypothetical protein PGB90_009559 [Kerria lacca]
MTEGAKAVGNCCKMKPRHNNVSLQNKIDEGIFSFRGWPLLPISLDDFPQPS